MVISGLLIEAETNKATDVAHHLSKIDGVEVHRIVDDFKIVITIEAETVDESYKIADSFNDIENIVTVCLVYSNFEHDPETYDPINTLEV